MTVNKQKPVLICKLSQFVIKVSYKAAYRHLIKFMLTLILERKKMILKLRYDKIHSHKYSY